MAKMAAVPMADLVLALSRAMDLVDRSVANHQVQVAYLAAEIAAAAGFAEKDIQHLLIAGALHDCGALSLRERLDALAFDAVNVEHHAAVGARLVALFPPFTPLAPLVRHHHRSWDHGRGGEDGGDAVPPGAHVLNLADRVSVLVLGAGPEGARPAAITALLRKEAGPRFNPDLVDALLTIAQRDAFWLDLASPQLTEFVRMRFRQDGTAPRVTSFEGLAPLFAAIIDFRSPFTATHTAGVAASAAALAAAMGMTDDDRQAMELAGHLHDLGKLCVPAEILEKPGALSPDERAVMRQHTYFTYHCLDPMEALHQVRDWSAYHHERLDGRGYPFGLAADRLDAGARMMAVADIFTALAEDRPYRAAMPPRALRRVMEAMAGDGGIDGDLVNLLFAHREDVDAARRTAQGAARRAYAHVVG